MSPAVRDVEPTLIMFLISLVCIRYQYHVKIINDHNRQILMPATGICEWVCECECDCVCECECVCA